jgi:hypothetical protein
VLRGSRGEASGAELGSSFVERIAVNTVNVPVARGQRAGPGWARCRPTGLRRGGAAVALRAGKSPYTWEGRQWFREGKEAVVPQDAPPNGSAPGPGSGRAVVAGSRDAGQASPLGGGRSWPPV